MTAVLKSLGSAAFRIGGAVAPGLTGQAAFRLFCTPPRMAARDPAEARLVEKLTPVLAEADAQRITTPDAEVQTYTWRTSAAHVRGRVLLVHGWTGRALVMALFVKPLREAGFDVVALDLPAHGSSSSRILNMPIGARALLAVADRLGPFTGLVAHSFGGPIAALAIEGGSPLTRSLALDRLVLISSPHALSTVTRDFGAAFGFTEDLQQRLAEAVTRAAGRPIETINTGDFLAAAGRPCLIVHDTDDDRVPYAEAEAIIRAAGGYATLMTTRGLGHRRIIVMPHVVRAAIRFLGESVGAQPS
jgi:pimeloyl-ACP methyl ester carboxylesterase